LRDRPLKAAPAS